MRHLLDAAEIQLAMEATGGGLIEIPPEVSQEDGGSIREAR